MPEIEDADACGQWVVDRMTFEDPQVDVEKAMLLARTSVEVRRREKQRSAAK